ncbi:MAG: DUF4350 domain-containing protein [Saprospiraceae bacterium]|nr:DUF4350 domain-containing protein [Saprospiraceae bacterium]MDW8482876.1 DUF4350 domain-containing protein [Saprospiraceae bacterium]
MSQQPDGSPFAQRYRLWIIAALLATGAIVGWLLSINPLHKRFSWQRIYREDSAQPFGTQVLFRLLQNYFSDYSLQKVEGDLYDALPIDSTAPATYFFIGEKPYYDSLDIAHLLAFVRAGSTAFICSEHIPFDLMFHLYARKCPQIAWSSYFAHVFDTVRLSLSDYHALHPTPAVYFAHRNKVVAFDWAYVPAGFFCTHSLQKPLGYANDTLVNFARFPYGKGFFYLHTQPLVFTNYHLVRPVIQRYVEAVLTYLPEGEIFWDGSHRYPRRPKYFYSIDQQESSTHPLKYILEKPPLAWAWYLLVALVVLYASFRSKRRQRIIPIWPTKENATCEYVNVIAQIHFRQKNYRYLHGQLTKTFFSLVYKRYGIKLREGSASSSYEDFVKQLSLVSKVPPSVIWPILFYATPTFVGDDRNRAMKLYTSIEQFWRKAKQ